MLLYIRVYIMLTWQYSRKETEKLYITLDRYSFGLQSLGNLVTSYYFKVYLNQVGMSGLGV